MSACVAESVSLMTAGDSGGVGSLLNKYGSQVAAAGDLYGAAASDSGRHRLTDRLAAAQAMSRAGNGSGSGRSQGAQVHSPLPQAAMKCCQTHL